MIIKMSIYKNDFEKMSFTTTKDYKEIEKITELYASDFIIEKDINNWYNIKLINVLDFDKTGNIITIEFLNNRKFCRFNLFVKNSNDIDIHIVK